MRPVTILADNINVLFPRDKKYNPLVKWTDLTIYFRYRGRLIKRCPTILLKQRVLEDYQELLELFDRQEWTEEEKKEEIEWNLSTFKNVREFKKDKKPIFRFLYDDPENPDIHQDHFLIADRNEFGHKPYMVEVVLSEKDLNESILKRATVIYLRECFKIKISVKDINFIKNMSDAEIESQWKEYKEKKDMDDQIKKSGQSNVNRIVFKSEAAKQIFGDDIRSVVIEGNKTTIIYENGEVVVEVKPRLKFIKKKRRKYRITKVEIV